MKKVKEIYFLTKKECDELEKKDAYICDESAKHPTFVLEDGTIMYPKYGFPASGEHWYGTLNNK